MRVGIFGGSFNPPHIGHLVIAEWMRYEFALDRILWIPASRSPFKSDEHLVDAAQRLDMVRCAVQGNPSFDVSDREVRRGGTSYTVDTLRELVRERPGDQFFLMMGSDTLAGFERWKDPDEILLNAELLVFKRPGDADPDVPQAYAGRVRFAEAPRLEVSATRIREHLAAGRSVRYLVPDAVRVYIEAHGLYTGR